VPAGLTAAMRPALSQISPVGVEALGVGGEEAGAGENLVGGFAAHGDGGEGAGEGMKRGDGEAGEGHSELRVKG